jgi:hypothetical protein
MTHLTFGRASVKSEVMREKKGKKKIYLLAPNYYVAMYI